WSATVPRGVRWGSWPEWGGSGAPGRDRSARVRELEGPRPLLQDEAVPDQSQEERAGREPAGTAASGEDRERLSHRQVDERSEEERLVRMSEPRGEQRSADQDETVGGQPGGDERTLLPAQQEEDEPDGRGHEGREAEVPAAHL